MSRITPTSAAATDRPAHLRLVRDGAAASRALVEEGERFERQGRRAEARRCYEQALWQLTDPADAPFAAAVLRWIARTHQVDADFEAALDCIEASLAVADACGDDAAIGHAINLQAIVHWHQGKLDDAERLYLQARESAVRAGEAKLAAMTSQNLGVIASIRGDHRKALRHYETSLTDYRFLGLTRDVCIALNNLGLLHTEMQRWEAAERAYTEAVELGASHGDVAMSTMLEINVAAHWLARGDLTRARAACDRAMALSRESGDPSAHGEAYKIYGIIAREAGEYAPAEAHFDRAERIAAQRQDILLSAETLREKAEVHRRQGRNRDTLQCLNKAHRLFAQLRAPRAMADLDRRTARLESEFLEVVRRWGESIESADRYTQGHCERVADISCALAARAGLDQKSLFWFRIGSMLHDVGKLIIPPEVLNRPGKLTDDEWALVKRHPVAGVEMLTGIDFPWDVLPMVRSHHERWDGAGYPDALEGDRIPYTARILCIADVYDALTSERAYKRAFTHVEAMEIMRRNAGKQFDPALFPLFEEVMRAREEMGHSALTASALRVGSPPPAALAGLAGGAGGLDELTGLPRRGDFAEAAAREFAARPEDDNRDARTAVLLIDVDRFKLINDTFGHQQGDDVLRIVADALREATDETALVARYAGDEFVVMLRGAGPELARETATRLRTAVAARRCAVRGGGEEGFVTVTLSIGVACAPQHGEDLDTVFAAADRALYEAKREGRNAVVVAGGSGDSPRPALDFSRFVGRTEELRRLASLLDQSARGNPHIVAVVGEAGVGKSTLLRQLGPEARLRAGSLVLGRSLEADARAPYGPWADVLSAVRALGIVPDRPWRELPHLVPALGDVGTSGRRPKSKYELLDEIVEYLQLAAASRPLVIVLDDMQWADSASWDALEFIVHRLTHERLLICLTVRAEETRGEARDRRARLAKQKRFTEIPLRRLTRDELSSWMEQVFHGQEVGRELPSFLHQHSEGNPLLVVQVLRTLLDEGTIWWAGDRWAWRPVSELRLPVGVSDLVARRLESMSPQARGLLTTAAVIGRSFDIELAVAAGAGSEGEMRDAIREGLAAAVLEPVATREEGRYSFTHALLLDAIRQAVNPRRLRRVHAKVAVALETLRPSAVAEIAIQFDRAGQSNRAYHYAMLAGQRAAAIYAHDEATAFFTLAERHAATPAELGDARLKLAHVAEAGGRYADAETFCDLVLGWLAEGKDNGVQALGVRRMRERLRAAQGRPSRQTLEACRALLAEAEAMGAETERVALLTMISQAHSRCGDWPAAEALARECVRMAERASDPRLLADALARLGATLLDVRPTEAVTLYAQAMEVFRDVDDRHGQARCHINTGIAHSRSGNNVAAEEAYERAASLARAAHAPDLGGLAALNLGTLHLKAGRYEEAADCFEEALRLFTTIRNEPRRLAALYNMAHLARERGDHGSALELYGAALALARSTGQADVEIGSIAGAGLVGYAVGRGEAVAAALRETTDLLEGRAEWWFQGRELVAALAVYAALDEENTAVAETRFRDALTLAEKHDAYGAAWLVAECAAPLLARGRVDVRPVIARYAPSIESLGHSVLSRRFATLTGAEAAKLTA